MELTDADHCRIANVLSVPQDELSTVCCKTGRCFINKGRGTELSNKDSVVIAMDCNEAVVQISHFLSVRCGHEGCRLIGVGVHHPFQLTETGQVARNFYGGFPKVKYLQPYGESVFFCIESVKRKVMLYNCGNDTMTVADYQRQLRSLPYELVVPVYPEKDDMLLIQGQNAGDTWYGQVLSVDIARKTVDVYFYVEMPKHPSIFVRESVGRVARNTVLLDAVIGLASGEWISSCRWQQSV